MSTLDPMCRIKKRRLGGLLFFGLQQLKEMLFAYREYHGSDDCQICARDGSGGPAQRAPCGCVQRGGDRRKPPERRSRR